MGMGMGIFLLVLSFRLGLGLGVAAVHHDHHSHRHLASDIPEGFISIDCGASEDSTSGRYGIRYKSDKDLISSGISRQILPEFYGTYELMYRSLRSFPEGTRNCYTLRPDAGRNNKYLIRASFVYGNYDGKNQTPVFDLYLGVNLWATLRRDNVTLEIITVPSTDYIHICLVNTQNTYGVPYISTLELRPLDNFIYQIDDRRLLVCLSRYDLGGRQQFRYPQDVYDRLWGSLQCTTAESNVSLISTDATMTETNDDPYKLPQFMLQTACQSPNSSFPLEYFWTPLVGSSRFYVCFHFAEIQKLSAGQFREMSIVFNGVHTITNSIKLEYLKPQTLCSKELQVLLNQPNKVSISATSTSTLPPILNGLEIFYSMDTPYSPTFSQDFSAIMDIKQQYKLSKNWQGDPCNPPAFLWEGLNCSTTDPSRIISLNLSSSNLMGDIPSSLLSLTEMEYLDLSYNELKGPLPEFLAQLPHLKTLNLTGNKLHGAVPETLLQKSKDGTLVLSVDGNPELCWSPPCNKRKELAIPILSSVIAALFLVILLGVILIFTTKRKTKEGSIESKKSRGSLKLKNRQYSYSEIVSITDNFRVTIGEGGFGKVYMGALDDQTAVAVKVLSPSSQQGYREFQAEAQLLMIVHHRNLVALVGYCDEVDHKALIYEYMANGNLKQHLFDKDTNTLSWIERLQIAVDAADGLEYLHNGCKPPIIHRDLKPANILLDRGMHAKIADFGLSRNLTTGNESQIITRLAGTLGYFDPENQICGNVNKQSDIYSFGIMLLELITGHPAITRSAEGNFHILAWVNSIIKTGDIQHIVDVRLQGEFNQNSAWKILEIAMSCTQSTAIQRPDMSHILEELKDCLAVEQNTSTERCIMSTRFLAESEIAPCLR